MDRKSRIADWERLLAHPEILQTRLPGAVLVGGTVAALHAGHRISFDHDHVIAALGRNYQRSIAALEAIAGWRTRRCVKGKLVLGGIEGIDAGLRNLRRSAPLETTILRRKGGDILVSVAVKLANPEPYDLTEMDLTEYKGIVAPWNDWHAVEAQCRSLAAALLKPPVALPRSAPTAC